MLHNLKKVTRGSTVKIVTIMLAIYYLVCVLYLRNIGYSNLESLFYIEKFRIVFEGVGYKLKVIGLTSPILPFFATFVFSGINTMLAPAIASCLGTCLLFYILASEILERTEDDFYLYLLMILFFLHPGMIYAACSGKSIYLVLIFFTLFFLNLFRYYASNTTFHIAISSICLVVLLFCDYKFIWLTLFFIPLVFSMAIQSLNLSEKEAIFRMTLSFNNPSLRRKLVNKTLALYIILFILPIAAIICYRLLNLTNANDSNYFLQSPYSTWTVLADRLNTDLYARNPDTVNADVSLLISAKVILFCPLILFAIYLFRKNIYQVLTLFTPFAFIEFLHIKYDKTILPYQYYLIFLILAILCVILKAPALKRQIIVKAGISILMLVQLYTGYYFLEKSSSTEEQAFITALIDRTTTKMDAEDKDMANYINSLSDESQVLIDDGVAYKVVAFTDNLTRLIMPYQDNYLSVVETPGSYANYILVASAKNVMADYTLLSSKYPPIVYQIASNSPTLQKVYETPNWTLYRFL